MGRKILFVTTDQQRYDSLGCSGGVLGRTPVIDGLAARGIRYERAITQSVVCMPSRSTMLTGQYPATHGVWMNGVPLPVDAPSIAEELRVRGYRTALVGKAHFEPYADPFGRFTEGSLARSGVHTTETDADGGRGAFRGFEHMELATHGAAGMVHYTRWLATVHPEAMGMYYSAVDAEMNVNAAGGGDTGAPQVHHNLIPRGWYHTDWVADRTISWLDSNVPRSASGWLLMSKYRLNGCCVCTAVPSARYMIGTSPVPSICSRTLPPMPQVLMRWPRRRV